MAAVGILCLALAGCTSSGSPRGTAQPPTPPSAPARSQTGTLDVRDYGAVGDGKQDDTAALQAAIEAAADGATIRFPEGTYLSNNLAITGRKKLTFEGDGPGSIVKRVGEFMATFTDTADIVVRKMAFDANGIDRYGGVRFYSSSRVRIEDNRFFDSNVRPVTDYDRYAVVFGHGKTPSEDVTITGNDVENLQVEVDNARRVQIVGNTSTNAVKTTAIGTFSIGSDSVSEDFLIADNKIVDPYQWGITVNVDPPDSDGNTFRRITIRDNQIVRTKTSREDIWIGTADHNPSTTGNVFEDISILRNRVEVQSSVKAGSKETSLWANSSLASGFAFQHLVIRGNTFIMGGKQQGGAFAIDLRVAVDSVVTGNEIVGAAKDIQVVDGARNRVEGNTVRSA